MSVNEKIMEFIVQNNLQPADAQTIAYGMGIELNGFDGKAFAAALDGLVDNGELVRTSKGKYARPFQLDLHRGKLQGNARGFAFFIDDEEGNKDLFIPRKALYGALHGDTVLVRRVRKARSEDEAEVVRIIERANTTVVGTFYRRGGYGAVEPDDRRISTSIYIRRENCQGINDRERVAVRICKFSFNGERQHEGVIEKRFGKNNDAEAQILGIAYSKGFNDEFPDDVKKEAETVSRPVTTADKQGRTDLTHLITVTIDGADSKDFDDAVSIEKTEDGYLLGVHIADVTAYVKHGSRLDAEALERGTSVYLLNTVLPMLPHELSNGICSLNEGEERLTLSVFVEIDKKGRIGANRIEKSVIRSRRRLVYDDVTDALEGRNDEFVKRNADIMPTLCLMDELAAILGKVRSERGSVDMEIAESQIELDKNGRAINVTPRIIGRANKIIEEFMLVANETVATQLYYTELPFLYRVHDEPEKEKMHTFAQFCTNLGIGLKGSADSVHPGQLAAVLEKAEKQGIKPLVSRMMLRAMSKAKYTDINAGHFGLALRNYCHFTSPIRRYPDLLIHRIIKLMLDGKTDDIFTLYPQSRVHEIGVQCSERERRAMEAEREVDDIKKAEFISHHVGQTYEAVVSGVIDSGFFAQIIENTVEGFIRTGDRYDVITDPTTYRIVFRNGTVLSLGQRMNVRIIAADTETGKVEMDITD